MNLSNKVSQEDRERVYDMNHHPDFQSGFDGGGGDDLGLDDSFGLDDLFGPSDGDSFGGGSNDSFGGGSSGGFGSSSGSFGGASGGTSGGFGSNQGNSSGGFGGFGGSSGGTSGGFGQQSSGFGGGFGQQSGGFGQQSGGFGGGFGQQNNGFGGGFGQQNNGFGGGFGQQNGGLGGFGQNQQMQQMQQPDTLDKLFDIGAETGKSLGALLIELFRSLKDRNADDYGYFSRNLIMTGGILIAVGVVMSLIGGASDIRVLSFLGMGGQLALCGGLSASFGVIGLGTAALFLSKVGDSDYGNINNISDEPLGEENVTDDYEDNIGDELDDLFSSDFDDLFNDDETSSNESEPAPAEPEPELEEVEPDVIDFAAELENISENTYITRESLFNTFKSLFPSNTPKFDSREKIERDSSDFQNLETICLKALSNLANCQLEDVGSHLESADETFFSYELRLKRINKVKQTDALAREVEVYLRDDANDDSVNATVSIEGDFYKIIVTKGETAVVTFGDVFKLQYCCDFFLNKKNKLPMITGINELGKVILDDAKNFDTMLIAGKPRSGKSWYVLSIIMSLMLFNSPDDVQFIIVDPKESNLFKTISLMPHVCGLHNDSNIIEILNDIIEVEAPRRKKLLSDNRCDDIWALRSKGINLPVLYLVIDEYITVINNLDKDNQKEFDGKIQTLISQLPSQGIRLLFVPHRATGVVNKTNRTMLQFTAAVRADLEDVKDTLGIPKWDRALTKPGGIALKSSQTKVATYVRGAALTPDDGENTKFIETAAKAFYKMGVDIPDMTAMRIACNRNEEWIKEELGGTGRRVQFDANNILDDIENMDFSSI